LKQEKFEIENNLFVLI